MVHHKAANPGLFCPRMLNPGPVFSKTSSLIHDVQVVGVKESDARKKGGFV